MGDNSVHDRCVLVGSLLGLFGFQAPNGSVVTLGAVLILAGVRFGLQMGLFPIAFGRGLCCLSDVLITLGQSGPDSFGISLRSIGSRRAALAKCGRHSSASSSVDK